MEALVFAVVGLLVLGLIIWVGTAIVTADRSRGSGTSDALGSFIDVFDPARARSERFLKGRQNQGEVAPSPDDENPPVHIDTVRMRATVRRPRPPAQP